MTGIELEAVPNAQAWRTPKHRDPFPEAELAPDPLVVRKRSDTPERRRCAERLEECTRLALDAWLRTGRTL